MTMKFVQAERNVEFQHLGRALADLATSLWPPYTAAVNALELGPIRRRSRRTEMARPVSNRLVSQCPRIASGVAHRSTVEDKIGVCLAARRILPCASCHLGYPSEQE